MKTLDAQIARTLATAMTVGQLREALEGLDDAMPVVMAANYGDLAGTTQALPLLDGSVREQKDLRTTAYSRSGVAIDEQSDDDGMGYCPLCDEEYYGIGKCGMCGERLQGADGLPWTDEPGPQVLVLGQDRA